MEQLASAASYTMHPSRRNIRTATGSRTRRILRRRQCHVLHVNVIARVHVRATKATGLVSFSAAQIAGEVYERDVRNFHKAGAPKSAVVATVLGDGDTQIGALDVEVREHDVAHGTPSAAAWKAGRFVG